jgi:hypothetical protein
MGLVRRPGHVPGAAGSLSGFFVWFKEPLSHRARDVASQTELIRQAWSASGKVYGFHKLINDLRGQGELGSGLVLRS